MGLLASIFRYYFSPSANQSTNTTTDSVLSEARRPRDLTRDLPLVTAMQLKAQQILKEYQLLAQLEGQKTGIKIKATEQYLNSIA